MKITLEKDNGEKMEFNDVNLKTFQSVERHLDKFGGIEDPKKMIDAEGDEIEPYVESKDEVAE